MAVALAIVLGAAATLLGWLATGTPWGAVAAGALVAGVVGVVDLDFRRGLIADAHTALIGVAAMIGGRELVPSLTWVDQVIGAAIGLGLFLFVQWGARRWRGVEGLGTGDVLLAGAGGAWTGWVWFGPWIALASGATLILAAMTGTLKGGKRIPFGPGLALSLLVVVGLAQVLRI